MAPSAEYARVPSSEWGTAPPLPFTARASRVLRHRRVVAALAGLLLAGALGGAYVLSYRAPARVPWPLPESMTAPDPPLYPEFHRAELALPQHASREPFANGRKYMWVADHTQCECGLFLRLCGLACWDGTSTVGQSPYGGGDCLLRPGRAKSCGLY